MSAGHVKLDKDTARVVEDAKTDKENGRKRNCRPHTAHAISTRRLSPDSPCCEQFRPWVSGERWKELRKMADTASKDKKIFLIKGGGFPAIRHALLERGWLEKVDSVKPRNNNLYPFNSELTGHESLTKSLSESDKLLKLKCEKVIMHKFLEHQPIDFLWTTKRDKYDWMLVKKDVIISRFCRSNFTSKEGLSASLNQMYWYTEPGLANITFPRCYILHNQEQMDEFVDDFRLTSCLGLLKWYAAMYAKGDVEDMAAESGKVPFTAIDFALERVNEYIEFACHNDIDVVDDGTKHIWEHEWDQFLTHHYLLIHENAKFLEDKSVTTSSLERDATKALASISKYWPQLDLDGFMNIWIVKPGNKCRGRGIQLMNNIKDIIGIVNFPLTGKSRFVVQKYIENPLIVYNTKFDIRQWFLITNSQPLTIWMYKDSYLRFSSQLFNLTNYHESVHLTNNAVQSKYKNHNQRDKALPDENMWDCHTFKTYLRQIGKSDVWEDRIYPGMRECLIGTMLACQESMDRRQNSFELYGADFMLTEDFTPWLIEINASPDLAPTTSVTARLCPQCLEDVIKVVVDRKSNPDANTGMFELIYKQIIPRAPAYLGLSLSISGKKIFKKVRVEKPRTERISTPVSTKLKDEIVDNIETGVNNNIPDLMTWLQPYNSESNTDIMKEFDKKPLPTVQHALTVIKSGLLMKTSSKKRKSNSHTTSRNRSGKKDKNSKCKVPASSYCYRNDNQLKTTNSNKECKKTYRENIVEKVYWQDPNTVKSVGNKRCYIEPAIWERDTASILRSCSSSVLQHNAYKTDSKQIMQVTPRVFSPGIITFNKMCPIMRKSNDSDNPTFSMNIKRLMHYKKTNKKTDEAETSQKKSSSFYSTYKAIRTPDLAAN